MKNSILSAAGAISALAATASAQGSFGNSTITNMCPYPVYLYATPAQFGGATASSATLDASGGSWTEPYSTLTNDQGWSLKLTKIEGNLTQIMQYEYTVHGDGTLWYDMSDVNGNPFGGAWSLSASGDSGCHPYHHAYKFPTDDAYGMQHTCPQDSTVILTLCGGDTGSAPVASSSAAAPAPAPATTSSVVVAPTSAPAVSSLAASSAPVSSFVPNNNAAPAATAASAWNGEGWSAGVGNAEAAIPSTTLSTAVVTPAPAASENGDNVVVVYTTEIAYTTVDVAPPSKREEHHMHHMHHARHLHGGRI